jgi:uncharacterized protein YjbI with pentapeptide repeats
MTKKAAAPAADWSLPKFPSRTFAFAGKFSPWMRDRIAESVTAEGGRVVQEPKPGVDFLLVAPPPSGRLSPALKKVIAALEAQGAAPEVLTPSEFGRHILPSREQAVLLLTSGDRSALEHWNSLDRRSAFGHLGKVDLAGCDLRGAALPGADFEKVAVLDGADLRDADLAGAKFYAATGVRFDGANLTGARLRNCRGCSFRGADLSGATIWGKDLAGSDFEGAKLRGIWDVALNAAGVSLRRADLTGTAFPRSQFGQADFSRADLSGAVLSMCDLTGAKLARASLRGTDLSAARLVNADLTGADLREACLVAADLTGAAVAGARLDSADLTGAKLDSLDLSTVKGADKARNGLGPRTRELDQAAPQGRRFTSAAVFDFPGAFIEVRVEWKGTGKAVETVLREQGGDDRSVWRELPSVGLAVVVLAHLARGGTLRLDSVKAKCDGGPLRDKPLRELALAAWCEAAGAPAPSPQALKKRQQAQQATQQALREELLGELRGGPAGVAAWNARPAAQRKQAAPYAGADLSGADLTGADLELLVFAGANFSGAKLVRAKLNSCDFRQANLEGADLTGASARSAKFTRCNLRHAVLNEVNFAWATLTGADLCGADLTSARIGYTKLHKAAHDEKTRWPASFVPPRETVWKGQGAAPGAPRPVAAVAPVAGLDFAAFLQRLRNTVDLGRLGNALQMLKAERFQLFAEVAPEALTGIVRSQSSASRLYSCRLAADGSYSCCTQNLRPCGGLGGSVCKHLLVLVVGLAKAGRVEPGVVDAWVRASRARRPVLDKDVMTETFLRYKGAEAGEIDWRPTETLPEDYYAL